MGEFDFPKTGGRYRLQAEAVFLQLIEELVPKAVTDLKAEPFRKFKKTKIWEVAIIEASDFPDPYLFFDETATELNWFRACMLELTPEMKDFRESLLKWLKKYNLEPFRFFDHFVYLLSYWNQNPERIGKDFSYTPFIYSFPPVFYEKCEISENAITVYPNGKPEEEFYESDWRFNFSFSAWQFAWEEKSDYRTELEAAFKRELEAYLTKIEKLAERRGFVRNPVKARKLIQSLEWFVLFQVKELEYFQIAGKLELEYDLTTIEKAVKKAARLLNLTPRKPSKAGRSGRKKTEL